MMDILNLIGQMTIFNFDPEDSRINVRDTIMSYNFIPSENTFFSSLDIEALKAIWGIEKDK